LISEVVEQQMATEQDFISNRDYIAMA